MYGGDFMPEISRFFGIVIAVFYNEHNPPHFHARYGEYKAAIDILS
jgi:phosphomannomutase